MVLAIMLSASLIAIATVLVLQSRGRAVESARYSTQQTALAIEARLSRIITSVELLLRAKVLMDPTNGANLDVNDFRRVVPAITNYSLRTEPIGKETLKAMTAWPGAGYFPFPVWVGRPSVDGYGRWLLPVGVSQFEPRTGTWRTAEALLDIERLRDSFVNLNVGPKGSAVLFRTDGVMITREPLFSPQIGQQFRTARLFQELVFNSQGTFQAISMADGVDRITAFRVVPSAPLVVVSGMAVEDALARWYHDAWWIGALVTVLVTIFMASALLFTREAYRRERAEREARIRADALRVTLDNMDQGLIMVDAKSRVRVYNKRASELLDIPEKQLATMPLFSDLVRAQRDRGELRGELAQQADDIIDHASLSKKFHQYERERPNGAALEVRSVPLPGG
ncbi:MAG: PAS-domain containing protein, partial [Alphaproteobacteria bacterium]